MAFTKRTVQFDMDFNVEGASTIGQLEDELTNINDELKKVDLNSDAFKELSKQAATANGKLREIDTSLQGFTSDEKSDSVKKLSEGLVGGFAAASSAAVLFGDQTSEAMQKAIQKAGALFVAADGIDKVFKAMSKTNIAAMKATVLGFKKSAIAAKNFAKTTRGALISTGIGAIIVAVGVLIANFDKITAWAKKFTPVVELFQKFKDIITGIGGAIKAAFRGEDIKEAYNEAIESQHRLNVLTERWKELIGETKTELDQTIELLKLQGASEEEILARQKEYYIQLVKNVDELKEEGKALDNHLKAQKDAYFQLQKIAIMEFNSNKAREDEREKEKDERIKKRKQAKLDAQKIEDDLIAKKKFTKLEIEEIGRRRQLEKIGNAFRNQLKYVAKAQEEINRGFEYQNELFEIALEGYYGYLDLKSQIGDFDKRGNELLEERTKELIPSEIRILKEKHSLLTQFIKNYGAAYGDSINDITTLGKLLDDNVKKSENSIKFESQGRRIRKELLEDATNELAIIRTAEDLYQKQLANNKELLNVRNEEIQFIIEYDVRQNAIMNKELDHLIKVGEDKEGILKLQKEIEKSDEEINTLSTEQADNNATLVNIKKEELNSTNKVAEAQTAITTQLIMQSRLYKQLQDLAGEYGGAVAEGIAASFDLIQTARQNAILQAEEDLDNWTEKNEESLQKIADKKKSLDSEEKDLNDLLADAEGDRYNDILAEIDRVAAEKEKNADREKDLMNQQIEFENQIIKAQYEADKAAKKSAVVQSIIQTLLATVSALPNVVLAAIVGITGAIATVAIAAQQIPSPKYIKPLADGGYTDKGGKYEATGTVHAGEWVANQSLVNDPVAGAMIATLESMQRGYADGGAVSDGITPTVPSMSTEFINYDKLAAAMAAQPIFASWSEGQEVGRKLSIVETRSSI